MAAVFLLSARIRDIKQPGKKKNKMSVSAFYPLGTLTLPNLTTIHDAFVTTLDGVTGGVIEESSIQLFPALPGGLKATAEDGSDVQEGALFTFDLEDTNYVDSLFVPAIKQSLLSGDGQSINLAAGLVQAFTDMLSNASEALPAAASNRFGIEYDAVVSGEKTFRK